MFGTNAPLSRLIREAARSITGSYVRAALPALGAVVAAASFTGISGVANTLESQVSDEFDSLAASLIVVEPPPQALSDWSSTLQEVPLIAEIPSVEAVGLTTQPEVGVLGDSLRGATTEVSVRSVDLGTVEVIGPQVAFGRRFNAVDAAVDQPLIMVPEVVADRLGFVLPGAQLLLDGRPVVVIGVFDDVERKKDSALDLLLLDVDLATPSAETGSQIDIVVSVELGTAPKVAQTIGRIVRTPGARILVPPDIAQFRQRVEGRLARLVLAASGFALVVGGIGIANSMTAAVRSRAREIGVRRAHGATGMDLFVHLIAEAGTIGFIGGVVGCVAGLCGVIAWATWEGVAPVLDILAVVGALAATTVTGVVAGLVPAVGAARVEPVEAMRN